MENVENENFWEERGSGRFGEDGKEGMSCFRGSESLERDSLVFAEFILGNKGN